MNYYINLLLVILFLQVLNICSFSDGHMYCCDGIPDDSVKEVEVINFLGITRTLRKNKNFSKRGFNDFTVIKITEDTDKKELYKNYAEKPLICHPLSWRKSNFKSIC